MVNNSGTVHGQPSLVTQRGEGYDELTFMWFKEAQSKEYLKKWVPRSNSISHG